MRYRWLGLLPPLCTVPLFAQTDVWKDAGIVHTARSPYAKLHDVPIRAVTIGDGFWDTHGATRGV